MANIFISYSRDDQEKAMILAHDIRILGHDVWFDNELNGGEKWWKEILKSIRTCDIFIFILSNHSLDSSVCVLEYQYASNLEKHTVPILVGEDVSLNLLPPILAKTHFIDYRNNGKQAFSALIRTMSTLPQTKPLPEPLPIPPEVPISYLSRIGQEIENLATLSYEEQSVLLFDLKKGLNDVALANDTKILLKKLRKRKYLFADIAVEIDNLLEDKEHDIVLEKELSHSNILALKANSQKRYKRLFIGMLLGIMFSIVIYTLYIVFYNSYHYVCYEKKIEVSNNDIYYKGCQIYTSNCLSYKKEHFGKYVNKIAAKKGYTSCINGAPLPISSSAKEITRLLQLGKLYYYGTSTIKQDYAKSKEYFLQAADLNSTDAYRYLANMYLSGHGVAVNKDKAKKWLEKGIDADDKKAQEMYDKYFNTVKGTSKK